MSDVAVTTSGFGCDAARRWRIGERTPIALLDAPASGRIAVGEALTNIAAADVRALGDVKLSANWMAACGDPGEDAALYDTVRAVGEELCPALGIAIPVGKDSLSMRTVLARRQGVRTSVVAPLSLVVTAFAPVADVRRTLTPAARWRRRDRLALCSSISAPAAIVSAAPASRRSTARIGDAPPDLDDPRRLVALFRGDPRAARAGLLLAYHDRSDGGLFVTLLEMAFAGRAGLDVDLGAVDGPARGACSPRSSAPCCRCATRTSAAPRPCLRGTASAPCARAIGRPGRASGSASPRPAVVLFDGDRVRAARRLVRDQLAHAAAARRSGLRRRGARCARSTQDDPGLAWR